jgi:hypothetical protein
MVSEGLMKCVSLKIERARLTQGRHTRESGYPVRRGGIDEAAASLEYWIARWSLSSGGALRRPGGGRRQLLAARQILANDRKGP